MTKEIKIEDNIIKEVSEIRGEVNTMAFNFGKLRLEKISLENRLKEIEKTESDMTAKYKGNMTKERKIADKLKEKHGEGYVDLTKGVFISSE